MKDERRIYEINLTQIDVDKLQKLFFTLIIYERIILFNLFKIILQEKSIKPCIDIWLLITWHNYIALKLVSVTKMNSIYRAISSREQNKNTISLFGVKTSTIKHRNFSNSRLISPHYFIDMDFNKDVHPIEKNHLVDKDHMTNKSSDLKKYCFNRLKTSQEQKIQGIRKNSSMKVIRRTDSHTFFNKSKIPKATNTECLLMKPQDKYNNQSEKGKSISIKRRVELIKKNQTKLKLIEKSKDNHQFKEALPKSDVSLGEGFQKCAPDFERTATGNKIWSENVLGQGLKKSSSSKIKILVKNPFQKLMRQEQQKNYYLKYPSELQTPIEEMKQSQILSKLQQSTSIAQRCQLQEMLAMM